MAKAPPTITFKANAIWAILFVRICALLGKIGLLKEKHEDKVAKITKKLIILKKI